MKKFGIKDQIGYIFGDLAGSMVTTYVSMFFLTFCTYVLGISPQYMAGLFSTICQVYQGFKQKNKA